jgi:hypothetical protein
VNFVMCARPPPTRAPADLPPGAGLMTCVKQSELERSKATYVTPVRRQGVRATERALPWGGLASHGGPRRASRSLNERPEGRHGLAGEGHRASDARFSSRPQPCGYQHGEHCCPEERPGGARSRSQRRAGKSTCDVSRAGRALCREAAQRQARQSRACWGRRGADDLGPFLSPPLPDPRALSLGSTSESRRNCACLREYPLFPARPRPCTPDPQSRTSARSPPGQPSESAAARPCDVRRAVVRS